MAYVVTGGASSREQLAYFTGNKYLSEGDYFPALGCFLEAISNRIYSHHEWYKRAYTNIGAAYWGLKNYPEALSYLDQAIAFLPHDQFAFCNRGLVRTELKDFQGALADFGEAIRIDPENAANYLNRSLTKVQVKDIDGAAEDCLSALRVAKDGYSRFIHYDESCDQILTALARRSKKMEAKDKESMESSFQKIKELRKNIEKVESNVAPPDFKRLMIEKWKWGRSTAQKNQELKDHDARINELKTKIQAGKAQMQLEEQTLKKTILKLF
jgi:tetratricopeptide (TPR) repeat protein